MADDSRSLEDIEAHVAYNEKMINDLSEMVVTQGREIDRLKDELKVLGRRVQELAEGEAAEP